jgi:hypothetical protein
MSPYVIGVLFDVIRCDSMLLDALDFFLVDVSVELDVISFHSM